MKSYCVASFRSDFGLIRPLLKAAWRDEPSDIGLVCVGLAADLSDEYLRDGIGELEIVRFPSPVPGRSLRAFEQTLVVVSDLCRRVADWISGLRTPPGWLVVPGDRFEMFASVIAAYYSGVPVAHIFGGDRSEGGHQDDSVRHAITKLAHVHFTVCDDSFRRVLNLGEEPWRVHNVGSPMVEAAREVIGGYDFELSRLVQPRTHNVLCTYHPITTEAADAGRQAESILEAFELVERKIDVAFILTYPNNEVGSDLIIEKLRGVEHKPNYFVFEDLGWKDYLAVMSRCDLVIGNSSSLVLEAPIVGVPSLNVGTRQKGRYAPAGVWHVEAYDAGEIATNILEMIELGRPPADHPYGDGTMSTSAWKILRRLGAEKTRKELLEKKIAY